MGEEPLLGRRGEEGEGRRPHNIAANVPTEVVLISYEMLAALLDLEPDVAATLTPTLPVTLTLLLPLPLPLPLTLARWPTPCYA